MVAAIFAERAQSLHILIVNTNRYAKPMPVMPIGACMAADAARRAGHHVDFLDLMFCRRPERKLERTSRRLRPDAVGLSVRNIDNNELQNPQVFAEDVARLVAAARRGAPGAPIVLGGAAAGVMPAELLRATGADLAVLGEAETVFPNLLAALQNGTGLAAVPGVVWIEDGVARRNPLTAAERLDYCPVPDLPRWLKLRRYLAQMTAAPLQSKRGCPFSCVYCTYMLAEGTSYRLVPPERVVEAVRRLVSFGARDIEFVDNVFNSPYEHAMAICEQLAAARTGARLQSMELNPRFVDYPLLVGMERAGFVAIGITAESAADAVLAGLGKGYYADDVRKAAAAVRRRRLPCVWIFMLGGPGETRQTVAETLRFAREEIRPSDLAFFNVGVRIYPGTRLEQIARQQGVLTVPTDQMLSPVFYVEPSMDRDWMAAELHKAAAEHLNLLGPETLSLPFLPLLHRVAHRLGFHPPLWRHAQPIRRLLRLAGMNV